MKDRLCRNVTAKSGHNLVTIGCKGLSPNASRGFDSPASSHFERASQIARTFGSKSTAAYRIAGNLRVPRNAPWLFESTCSELLDLPSLQPFLREEIGDHERIAAHQ